MDMVLYIFIALEINILYRNIQGVQARGIQKSAYVVVPKSFIKFVFSTVYRVTQKDFYARRKISVEVRRDTVLLEYETGRYLWEDKIRQHVEVAVSCHCRRCPA
jgi:hypothetical protein